MPLNADPRFHLSAAMEEAFEERGKHGMDRSASAACRSRARRTTVCRTINHDQRDTAQLLAPRTAAPVTPAAGAAEIPTAAEYFLQWETRIRNATRAEHIGPVWNVDKQLHKQIGWTTAHSYEDLKSKVSKAAESMRVMT
jgi:hypothetical protein